MSKQRYLARLAWPDSTIDEPRHAEPSFDSFIEILRHHGSRLSRIEELIEDLVTNGTSYRLLNDDPPCDICGKWSENGRLCPDCASTFPWF